MPRGAVSALDITATDPEIRAALLDALIRNPRVWYVINKGKIWSRTDDGRPWDAENYSGNPHTDHIHVSLVQSKAAHGDTSRWLAGSQRPDVPDDDSDGPPRQGEAYTVRSGDTLSEIAFAAGTEVEYIVRRNDIAYPDGISVGQVLHIPTGEGWQGNPPGSDNQPKPEPKPDKSKGGGKFAGYDHAPGSRTLREGSRSDSPQGDVSFLQRVIGRQRCGPDDGLFGENTAAGVAWYQRMRKIEADSIVGRVTWSHILGQAD